MKIVAFKFAFLLGFLTIQPLLNSKQKTAESTECCSKSKCKKDNEPPKKDCQDDKCNPFMACALGNFYDVQAFPIEIFVPIVEKQKLALLNGNRILSGLSDCWHPPELI